MINDDEPIKDLIDINNLSKKIEAIKNGQPSDSSDEKSNSGKENNNGNLSEVDTIINKETQLRDSKIKKLKQEIKNFEQIKSLFFNYEKRKQHKNFVSLLESENIPDARHINNVFKRVIENSLKDTVDKIALIQYLTMQKSNDWGEYGQQQIEYSYAKMMLNISFNEMPSEIDMIEFYNLIDQKNDYTALSVEDIKKLGYSISFYILDKEIEKFKQDLVINSELEFLNSSLRIFSGKNNNYYSIIFGEAKVYKTHDHFILYFTKELSRTPVQLINAVTLTSQNIFCLRKETIDFVLEYKWNNFIFDYSIEDSLREVTLKLYNIHNEEGFINNRDSLYNDIHKIYSPNQ
ncbi:MAG: hypothetical protein AB1782_14810 [Cyanobacteriota bacterium]